MGFVYDPEEQLAQIFPNANSLSNISSVIDHLHRHRKLSSAKIASEITNYKQPIHVSSDIVELTQKIAQIRRKSMETQKDVLAMTASIKRLDTIKKNLTLSMKVLERLQMLASSFNSLMEVAQSRDYEKIATYLGAVKELMSFFKAYKSIDEISALTQQLGKTQNKLVEDVFIDFEESFTNNIPNDKLVYGCEILELADRKNKDRLLTWFYNMQLKEIQSIFNTSDEAGDLENLSRKYIFFNNILKNIRSNHMHVFPESWKVDWELTKLFCKMTKQDLSTQLQQSTVKPGVLLEALTKTLEFEKSLNEVYNTTEFSNMISGSFEPYLKTWVDEQDSVLKSKFMEFHSSPKIPNELMGPETAKDLLLVLKVNNVPNFADSSVELFKIFSKILLQIIKLSNGEILIELSRLFSKYLSEYHFKILAPIVQQAEGNPKGIEPIKYLTMVLNTADYINNNINDLEDKFKKLIDPTFKERINFDSSKNLYFELIGKTVKALTFKISIDLQFPWRQFENNNWQTMDGVSDTSTYMEDFVSILQEDCRIILPLIIRDSYVRNFCDRLVELVVNAFINKLNSIRPLTLVNVEQILLDVTVLKRFFKTLPLNADINFDKDKVQEGAEKSIPKNYTRFMNSQFLKLETLLKLLMTPSVPIDSATESYINLIGDKSEDNFSKFLSLKNIEPSRQQKYMETFKLQITLHPDLVESSPILSVLETEDQVHENTHPSSQAPPSQIDYKEVLGSKSPEPQFADFLKTNSAKIQNIKINNPLRDFSINGEGHVNKLNENFKNFGKFFRTD
ncbi:putative vacuolar sorting-associated protein [Clavispora lusitaniae]|uniref:Uncharacterized protein n=2 Tax=Clavispora lusitaniae TaxID=36911 RepID=C4Y5L3_CLAL4|nr:uncharacterized protein CLUG_03447 [Clavispora lusitaniae ATCC 42720]KAF5210219.1 Vacuolar protein sorting-associated protein 53 [Clavispora lusitaniae]EEQ39319.1 hypothetical protein CLUG_03447 [Clavispora lusitaniae ATCC 42720]KAF7582705.1 Vps53-like, N-terminal family protein [Clavispora lusitaniae]QFZ28211.1 putative vacuolar sorting-associated protein [Clavispora lusitaniae]QFZ33874.1 putative vacuolar sorting-associated protein [Clavispora lusitaniae]